MQSHTAQQTHVCGLKSSYPRSCLGCAARRIFKHPLCVHHGSTNNLCATQLVSGTPPPCCPPQMTKLTAGGRCNLQPNILDYFLRQCEQCLSAYQYKNTGQSTSWKLTTGWCSNFQTDVLDNFLRQCEQRLLHATQLVSSTSAAHSNTRGRCRQRESARQQQQAGGQPVS